MPAPPSDRPRLMVAALALVCAAGVVAIGCRPRPPRRPLQDTDPVFIIPAIKQTADARKTGDIPRLIELLESEDSAVRLAAAEALKELTGEEFGYRAWADEASRAQAVARWRQWAAERGLTQAQSQ